MESIRRLHEEILKREYKAEKQRKEEMRYDQMDCLLLAGRERGQQWELIPSGRRIVAYIRRADGKKNGLVSSIK